MSSPPDTDTTQLQESSADEQVSDQVSGPHYGFDRYGRLDHRYWRCERCGFESTDPRLREGCPCCDAPGEDDG